ncbi:MAG TPA: hypothetical protein DDW28_05950 [Prevotella sp.]|nr:hypothetical protein [Candidatus Segatella violae]
MIRFIRYILMLCCVAGFMSCGSDDSPSDPSMVRVVFRLYVPTTTAESRADADPTEDAETWESAINMDKLHIVLYTKNGTSIGGLENVALVATSAPNIYDVTGSVLVDKLNLKSGKFDGQIMIYANMDGVNETSNFNEGLVNSLTFTANSGKHTIPMWGLKQLNVSMKAGSQTNIGTINLLRAEAKIRVFLRSDMVENYELTNVKLSQANKQGYCLPQYQNIKGVSDVQALEHDAFAHFLSKDDGKLMDVDMTNKPIYVPEYENKVSSTNRTSKTDAAVIKLTLLDKRDNQTTSYTLPFVEYNANGAPTQTAMDIVRDHYYKFEVYKNDDGMLRVRLKVRQWYVVKHSDIQM